MLPSEPLPITNHVVEVWEDFRERVIGNPKLVQPKLRQYVKPNLRFLHEACSHALVDLQRMISFHNLDPVSGTQSNPSQHKYAGVVARWIAKVRPIYIEDGHPLTKVEFKLNAFFAVWVFRSYLDYQLPAPLISALTYSFHFREVSSETMALFAYAIDTSLRERFVQKRT
jgi:hypothetical protein